MASNIEFWTWTPPPGGHDIWTNDAFRFMIRVRLYDANAEPRQPGKDWNYYWPRDNVDEISECIVDWYQYAIDPAQGYSGPVSLLLQNFGYDMGDASIVTSRLTTGTPADPSHRRRHPHGDPGPADPRRLRTAGRKTSTPRSRPARSPSSRPRSTPTT
ncbi:MAG: hypothetical protein IT442_02360 [Phycisphaeraceae bacterium]|nr:hypothetical protein [Phycisphaeraceae bacterium]